MATQRRSRQQWRTILMTSKWPECLRFPLKPGTVARCNVGVMMEPIGLRRTGQGPQRRSGRHRPDWVAKQTDKLTPPILPRRNLLG